MKLEKNPKIVLAGSVNSSKKVLEKLYEHKVDLVHVLSLSPEVSKNVSGYKDLGSIASGLGIPYTYFTKINSKEIVELISDIKPDLLFVVGLSQIIKKELLEIPLAGCIGYHPTLLPKGRGRAAIAWILLGKAPAAVSFFKIDEGMDSGPLLAQKSLILRGDEYAQELIDLLMETIGELLDDMLPKLKEGSITYTIQDESKATYLGKRTPVDGKIDWQKNTDEIESLIRATSHPLPGAYSYFNDEKIKIWKAIPDKDGIFTGIPGTIATIQNGLIRIHTKSGSIQIKEYDMEKLKVSKVGMRFS